MLLFDVRDIWGTCETSIHPSALLLHHLEINVFFFTFAGSINHSYASVLSWKKRLFARLNSKYNKFSFEIW